MVEALEGEIVGPLPKCGICLQERPCANCQDSYGMDYALCGWPICRSCRDQGPPEGVEGPSVMDVLSRLFGDFNG